MKNKAQWKPTKFAYRGSRMRIGKGVRASSRMMVHTIAEAYNRLLPKHAKGVLLDLGCGQVPMYAAYKDLVSEVQCVDWGSSVHHNIHLDREMDLNKPLDLPDQTFDTIILSDVLEHIAEPSALIAEIHRILKPGGKLLMNVPFFYYLHEQPHDYHRYTKYALEYMAVKAQLKVLEISPLGGWFESASDLCGKALHSVPLIGKWVSLASFYVTYAISGSFLGEAMRKKTAGSFPYGYVMVAQRPA